MISIPISIPNNVPVPKVRYFFGSACIAVAWLFPYSAGGSRDVLQQIFALGMLTLASLSFGLGAVPRLVTILTAVGVFVMIGTSNAHAGAAIAGAAGLLLACLACHVGVHLRSKPEGLLWLLVALVGAALINAAEGLLQWFGLVSDLYPWVVEPERRGVAYGALRQTNLFATFLCVGSVCTIWLVHKRRLSEPMAWFFSMFLMFAVAASGSRTGILEVITLAVLAFLWKKFHAPAVTRLLVGQVLLLSLAMFTLPVLAGLHGFGFSSGVARVMQNGPDPRFVIWSNAIDMVWQRPWLGWGWSELGYGHYATLFQNRFDGLLGHAHNLPLQVAVEFGLPLAVLVFAGMLWCIYLVMPWTIAEKSAETIVYAVPDTQFARAIVLLIVGIHSMLEYPLWYAGFLFLSGLFIGYQLPAMRFTKSQTRYNDWSRRAAAIGALILLGMSLLAWQQYANVSMIYKTPFGSSKEVRLAVVESAIADAPSTWMFREQLDFARIGLTAVTAQNAYEIRQRAERLLHFSAEPLVIRPLLLSLWYLEDLDALEFQVERFCRAFPSSFQVWRKEYANHPVMLATNQLSEACRALSP